MLPDIARNFGNARRIVLENLLKTASVGDIDGIFTQTHHIANQAKK